MNTFIVAFTLGFGQVPGCRGPGTWTCGMNVPVLCLGRGQAKVLARSRLRACLSRQPSSSVLPVLSSMLRSLAPSWAPKVMVCSGRPGAACLCGAAGVGGRGAASTPSLYPGKALLPLPLLPGRLKPDGVLLATEGAGSEQGGLGTDPQTRGETTS